MGEDWDVKVTRVAELLSDGDWHELSEIEEIYPLPEDEREKISRSAEEAGVIEVKREDGRITAIRGTDVLEGFRELPKEK